jgi:hypothetical protein
MMPNGPRRLAPSGQSTSSGPIDARVRRYVAVAKSVVSLELIRSRALLTMAPERLATLPIQMMKGVRRLTVAVIVTGDGLAS